MKTKWKAKALIDKKLKTCNVMDYYGVKPKDQVIVEKIYLAIDPKRFKIVDVEIKII